MSKHDEEKETPEIELAAKYGFRPVGTPPGMQRRAFVKDDVTIAPVDMAWLGCPHLRWWKGTSKDGNYAVGSYYTSLELALCSAEIEREHDEAIREDEEAKAATPVPPSSKVAAYVPLHAEPVEAVQFDGTNHNELEKLTGWRCAKILAFGPMRSLLTMPNGDNVLPYVGDGKAARNTAPTALAAAATRAADAPLAASTRAADAPLAASTGAAHTPVAAGGRQAERRMEVEIAERQWLIKGLSGWWVCSAEAFTSSFLPCQLEPLREVALTLRCKVRAAMSDAEVLRQIREVLEAAKPGIVVSS
jgi:hypothetical protein